MLAALGLDGFRSRLDEFGTALAGLLIATVGVCAPWFEQAGSTRIGLLGDSGRYGLIALIAAFALLWRYANLGGPGHLLGVLIAAAAALLTGLVELIQLEATYGDGGAGIPESSPGWGLWLFVTGAGITMLGVLIGAQLHANREQSATYRRSTER